MTEYTCPYKEIPVTPRECAAYRADADDFSPCWGCAEPISERIAQAPKQAQRPRRKSPKPNRKHHTVKAAVKDLPDRLFKQGWVGLRYLGTHLTNSNPDKVAEACEEAGFRIVHHGAIRVVELRGVRP